MAPWQDPPASCRGCQRGAWHPNSEGLRLPTHCPSWWLTGLVVHRLKAGSLNFPETLQFPEDTAPRAEAATVPLPDPVAKGLFGGPALFLVWSRLHPLLLVDHPADSKGSLQTLTLLRELVSIRPLTLPKDADNESSTLFPTFVKTGPRHPQEKCKTLNIFPRAQTGKGVSHYKSQHAPPPARHSELAHRPLGTVVPVGGGARQTLGGLPALFQRVSEARLRSRTWASLRERPSAQPLSLSARGACAVSDRRRRSWSRDRAGLLALSPGACALAAAPAVTAMCGACVE